MADTSHSLLFLSQREVIEAGVLNMDQVVPLMEKVYGLHWRGETVLPNKGVTVAELLESLDGEGLAELLTPAENIFVEDVRSRYANCNLVKIGTETHGEIRNVHVRNVEGWTRYSLAIEAVDGSVIDGVTYEDVRMSNCASPFVVRLGNRGRTFEGGPDPAPIGAIRNVTLRNIRNTGIGWVEVKGGPGVGTAIGGLKGHPVENVLIEDCDLLLFGSIIG